MIAAKDFKRKQYTKNKNVRNHKISNYIDTSYNHNVVVTFKCLLKTCY